jgi:hypothetical protein
MSASDKSVVHTPGPWRQGGVKEILPVGKCREIVADDGRIGLVYGTTDDDCKANARLVEAAPEMLAAIRGALRIADLWVPSDAPQEHFEESRALYLMLRSFEEIARKVV